MLNKKDKTPKSHSSQSPPNIGLTIAPNIEYLIFFLEYYYFCYLKLFQFFNFLRILFVNFYYSS